jgi:hypothetical protein
MRAAEVCLNDARNDLFYGGIGPKRRQFLKFLKARTVSTGPFRNYRHSIANYAASLSLTYTIILSYTPTVEKQYLININQYQ